MAYFPMDYSEPKNKCIVCGKLWEGNPYDFETDDNSFPCPSCYSQILELKNLKEFIANGGKCWRCGDTGIAEPTFTEPSGSYCGCAYGDSAEYILEHWEEIQAIRNS